MARERRVLDGLPLDGLAGEELGHGPGNLAARWTAGATSRDHSAPPSRTPDLPIPAAPSPIDRTVRARGHLPALAAIGAALLALLWPHLGYVPIWDGAVYARCALDAAQQGLSMASLRCAGHPSQAWALLMALPQRLGPGSATLLTLTSAGLGIVAAAAFRVLLGRAFPAPDRARELDLLTAAAALHPVVVSTLLQPNVDFGVYLFFLVVLAGLVTPGRVGTATALVGGLGLVFSKETGVAAYGLAAATITLAQAWRAGGTRGAIARRVATRGALLAIPVVLFLVHGVTWQATRGERAVWKHAWQRSTLDAFVFFDLSDPVFVSYAAGLFVLGFGWTVWLPVVLDALVGARRALARRAARPLDGGDPALVTALVLLTALLTYLLTSYRTWSNLRYFALLYPLFLVVGYAALCRLGWGAVARRAVLGSWVALFVVADGWSADPLSRAVYGTFDTGAGTMYRMTALTGEFEGAGRDQLVYNLQFTGYHHVQDALYGQLRPTASTVIAAPERVSWNIWSPLDAATRRRTMRRAGVVTPTYLHEGDLLARPVPEAWFLAFSNAPLPDRALERLLGSYRVADSVVVVASGQRLVARRLVPR